MGMSDLKIGFISYLKSLAEEEGNSSKYRDINSSDISIFKYSDEFKDYIEENVKTDSLSIESMSINDIMKMEIINGKLIDPNKKNDNDKNSKNTISTVDILNELLQDSSFTDLIESNSQKGIQTDELRNFLNIINGYDANMNDFSTTDIMTSVDNIKQISEKNKSVSNNNYEELKKMLSAQLHKENEEGNLWALALGKLPDDEIKAKLNNISDEELAKLREKYGEDLTGLLDLSDEELKEELNLTDEQLAEIKDLKLSDEQINNIAGDIASKADYEIHDADELSYQGATVPSGGSSSGGVNYSGNYTSQTSGPKNLNQMNKEELEAEKTKASSKLNEKKGALATKESELGSLKEVMDESYNTFLEEAEKLELAESENLEKLEEVKGKITDKETSISETETEINDKKESITNAELEKDKLTGEVASLTSAKASLQSALSGNIDENRKAEINADIAEITEKIEELNQQIAAKETEIQDYKDEVKNYEEKLEQLQQDLEDLKELNNELMNEILPALEQEIAEKNIDCPSFNEYKEAQIAYSECQNDIIQLKAEVDEAQTYYNSVELAISNYDVNKEISEEYNLYNAARGQSLADAAKSLYGNVTSPGGYCARGVEQALAKIGVSMSGNAYELADKLAAQSGFTEVTSSYSIEDIKKTYENGGLPPGAILVWSQYDKGHTNSDGKYGHVFIADGYGNEISDFKSPINTCYHDWHATYRIFIPT